MLKFLLVVAVLAGVVYWTLLVIERRRPGGGGGTQRGVPRPPSRGPRQDPGRSVAPDDDEDFLRWLDAKRRKDLPE